MYNRLLQLTRLGHSTSAAGSARLRLRLTVLVLLLAGPFAGIAQAAVDLRVEARPIANPIEVFVTVTDANGNPVGGLTGGDFTVTLDGDPIVIQPADFSLPPAQDPGAKVSVVFVMDFSGSVQDTALVAMQDAVINFIGAMTTGDYAAIVKFNDTNPDRASVVQPFTPVDGGPGTAALVDAVLAPYPGIGTNLLDAVNLAVEQFAASAALPAGPKAVIVISDGGENSSATTSVTVVNNANESSIALFNIGIGDVAGQNGLELMTFLASETGGGYIPAPTNVEIAGAYATVSQLLNNEYLLTFQSSITDCSDHAVQIEVVGQVQPATRTFSRCSPVEPAASSGGGGSIGLVDLAAVFAGIGIVAWRRRQGLILPIH